MFNKLYNSYNKFRAAAHISPKAYFARQRIFLLISTIIIATTAVVIFFAFNKPVEVSASWYNDSWLYRKTLTIDPAQVAGDLKDFPMLVSFTDSDVGTHAQETGDDLVFIDSAGEKLAHEIESYASTTGTLVAWVKVPRLSGSEHTQIHMYYGNASVSSQQQAEKVWDEDFVMVQHLEEDGTGTRYDSTQYNNDGATSGYDGDEATSTGRINGADVFDNVDDRVDSPDSSSLDVSKNLTVSAWVKLNIMPTTSGETAKIIEKRNNGWPYYPYILNIRDADTDGDNEIYFALRRDHIVGDRYGGTQLETSTWYYLVGTYDGSNMNVYVNGSLDNSGGFGFSGELNNTDSTLSLNYGSDIDGIIDEARISKTERSANWIQTEYNNQNDPASFFSVSAQEQGKGPVGYWSFDRGSGLTAYDESGQGNDGTITGAEWVDESQCVSGKCLYFDGVDDYVNAGNNENTNFDGDFTYQAWFRFTGGDEASTGDGWRVISKQSSGDFYQFRIADSSSNTKNGFIEAEMEGSGTSIVEVTSDVNVKDGSWHYVAVERSGTSFNIYLDGLLENSTTVGTGAIESTGDLTISSYNGTSDFFHGYIDEVKIYPYARSADEIKADYNAGLAGMGSKTGAAVTFGSESDKWMSDGLVGYWKFDESATTSGAIDSSGNGNDGTYEGNASTTAGKFGNGGVFDGDGDYADAGNSTSLNNLTTFSLSWWMKPDNRDNNDWIIGKHTNGQSGTEWFVDISDVSDSELSLVKDVSGGSGSESAEWDDAVFSDEWQHIIIVVPDILDSPNWSLYRNGELVAKTAYTENSGGTYGDDSAHNFQIGSNGFYDFDGQIDEVRIYNRALSRDEVAALHEWAPGPVAWWKFDEGEGETTTGISYNGDNHTTTLYPGTSGSNIATSSMWHSTGKFGKAIEFDGTDDYLWQYSSRLGDPYVFTYEAWIYPRSFGENDQGGIMGATISSHIPRSEVRLHNDDAPLGSIRADVDCNGTNAESEAVAGSIELDKWQHVAVTFNYSIDGYIRIFVDGVEVEYDSQIEAGGEPNANNFFIIGETYDYQRTFDGYIDDVRVYDYVRTQKQILDDMSGFSPETNNSQALKQSVLHLKFDEGKGAVAYDSSIHANNGTLYPGTGGTNTASSAMWSLNGHSKGAMEFDGVDDYVSIANSNELSDMAQISISTWIKPSESQGWSILHNGGVSSPAYSIYNGESSSEMTFRIGTDGGGDQDLVFDEVTEINVWQHYVFIWDGDFAYIYKDGEIVASGDLLDGDILNSSASLTIGNPDDNSNYNLDGLIDEVQIWNYALSASEVKQVYNDTKGAVWGSSGSAQSATSSANSASASYCVPGDTAQCDAPVLELNFDEKEGATAYDTSGNGNDGTMYWMSTSTNGGWYSPGKYGSALKFDGTDDYVDINNTINIDNEFSWNFWIKTTAGTGEVIGWANARFCDFGSQAASRMTCTVDQDTSGAATTNSTVNDGKWHHIAFTSDSSLQNIYFDGVLEDSSSETLNTTDSGAIVGFRFFGSDYFDGLIDEVKIYNYARTPAQIAWDYNGGGPIAHWDFDECAGSTIHDQSGNNNHGTLNLGSSGITATGTCAESASSFWYNGRDGKLNGAGSFDGGDDYISIPYSSILQPDIPITISAWLYREDSDTFTIFANDYNQDSYYGAWVEVASVVGVGYGDGGAQSSGNRRSKEGVSGIDTGQWYHIVGVIRGATDMDIYINGENDGGSYSGTGDAITYNSSVSAIGVMDFSGSNPPQYGTGKIDEVKLWNYALTPEQVKTEYNGGAVSFR